jgi:transcriptional regulator with XRE-family HTH domain
MGPRTHRTTVGEHYNEGARRLWKAIVRDGIRQADVAARLECDPGALNKWLFGQQRPSAKSRYKVQDEFGIEPRLWDEDPKGPCPIPSVAA